MQKKIQRSTLPVTTKVNGDCELAESDLKRNPVTVPIKLQVSKKNDINKIYAEIESREY